MKLKHFASAWMAALVVLFAPMANAATLSFNFAASDANKAIPSGDYINVAIEETVDGSQFTISNLLAPLAESGIKQFGFNLTDGGDSLAKSDLSLGLGTENWVIKNNKKIGGSPFDFVVRAKDTDPTRGKAFDLLDTLEFTVAGLALESLTDFGLQFRNLESGAVSYTGVAFAAAPVTPVPLPAAFWLFGTAILGIAGFRKVQRREKQAVPALA